MLNQPHGILGYFNDSDMLCIIFSPSSGQPWFKKLLSSIEASSVVPGLKYLWRKINYIYTILSYYMHVFFMVYSKIQLLSSSLTIFMVTNRGPPLSRGHRLPWRRNGLPTQQGFQQRNALMRDKHHLVLDCRTAQTHKQVNPNFPYNIKAIHCNY